MSIIVGSFRLSPELFVRSRLRNRCRDGCSARCCQEGVAISLYEAERVKARAAELQSYLLEPFDFEGWNLVPVADLSTPLLYENTPREQCWFLMHDRRCALHALALDRGLPVASLKPYFCRLFPLTLITLDIDVTEIGIDGKAYKTCLVEGEQEDWLYRQFESDLRRVIGDANLAELERMFPG